MDFWSSFWLIVELFFFLAYLIVLFQIVGDIFRDSSLGGLPKALWVLFLILVPLITALIYLIVRGRGMAQRRVALATQAEESTQEYIRTAAGNTAAQQIATAKSLLDSGAITAAEFEQLKKKALES